MNREEFKAIAARMRKIYTRDFIPDQATFDTWYQLLADLPFAVADKAVVRWMQTEERIPTPAGLRRIAAEIMATPEESLTEQEAWSLVSVALRRSSYYAEEEYAQLPHSIQRAVGSAANLREWAKLSEDDLQTVVHSQFLRSWRAVVEQNRRDAATSPEVRGQIGQIRQEAGIERKEADMIGSG